VKRVTIKLAVNFSGFLPEGADLITALVCQDPNALGFWQYTVVNLNNLLTTERRFFCSGFCDADALSSTLVEEYLFKFFGTLLAFSVGTTSATDSVVSGCVGTLLAFCWHKNC
jgi:hypothetical protein